MEDQECKSTLSIGTWAGSTESDEARMNINEAMLPLRRRTGTVRLWHQISQQIYAIRRALGQLGREMYN